MENLAVFKDVFVKREGSSLILGNSAFVREFDLSKNAPRTVSMRDAVGREFASAEKKETDFAFCGFPKADESEWILEGIEAEEVPESLFDGAHLRLTLRMREPVGDARYRRIYRVYPEIPGMSVSNAIRTPVMPNMYWSHRRKISMPGKIAESVVDSIRPAEGILPVKSVEFFGRTDYSDLQVEEHRAEGDFLQGNLLFCEDSAHAGFQYLQEAPPSSERRDFEEWDFRRDCGGSVLSCNWGIAPEDIRGEEEEYPGCRNAILLYHDESERESVRKRYLAVRFPVRRGMSVTVNPWGCRDFRSRVSPSFFREEFRAAAEAGATQYQIDDGWQQGVTYGIVPLDNKRLDEKFWTMKESLAPEFPALISDARKNGIEPSLWFAPSANCEYRDHAEMYSRIKRFYTEFGIRIFKIDSMRIRTWEAERNLRGMLTRLRKDSNGEIMFDLDTTNGQRPGYFMFLEYGNIFLENRYVFGGIGYHPEKTLASLWNLTRWTRAQTLQIEIPAPSDADPEFYRKNGLSDPRIYPLEYWAGIAMFANPLLWFAPSTVPPEDRKRFAEVMNLHRKIRDGVFAGEIRSVGGKPDGKSITGFHSDSGYAVLFREAGEKSGAAEVAVPGGDWKNIYGNGTLRNGWITLPEAASFAVFAKESALQKRMDK